LIDVNLFFTSGGLPFQDDSTEIDDVNNGNILSFLVLFGRYGEITRVHLAKVQRSQLQDETM
jgi:hypothetical protein